MLLGGITSLPEVATTVTASLEGNAGMAVSNILGGVSMQVTILAMVDFWHRKKPLSSSASNVTIMLQGVFLIIMLAITTVFILSNISTLFHIGLGSVFLFAIFFLGVYTVYRLSSYSWISYSGTGSIRTQIGYLNKQLQQSSEKQKGETKTISVSSYLGKKGLRLFAFSLLILIAGYFVIISSEAIAGKTGLSENFAGLVLVAITTSLPEVSTTLGAIRLKKYDMALSNIFGTNLFDVSLIFIADLLFFEGPILGTVDRFAIVASMLGIVLTSIYLIGIIAKSKKQILGIGYDSILILFTYLLGIVLLYHIR